MTFTIYHTNARNSSQHSSGITRSEQNKTYLHSHSNSGPSLALISGVYFMLALAPVPPSSGTSYDIETITWICKQGLEGINKQHTNTLPKRRIFFKKRDIERSLSKEIYSLFSMTIQDCLTKIWWLQIQRSRLREWCLCSAEKGCWLLFAKNKNHFSTVSTGFLHVFFFLFLLVFSFRFFRTSEHWQ